MKQSQSASRVAAQSRPFACALMLLTVSSAAVAASGTWTGAVNGNWNNNSNWSASPYPGFTGTGDVALIDNATNQPVTYASANISKTLASVTVDADANAAAVTLKVTNGTLTVTGLTRIVAETSSSVDAMLWVNAGTFVPELLEFEGDVDDGAAIGDFDVSVTVDGNDSHSGTDTLCEGLVDFFIGNATVQVRDLEMGANANLYVLGEHLNSILQMKTMDPADGFDYRPVKFEAAASCQLVVEIP
jgi:hypothetical protein